MSAPELEPPVAAERLLALLARPEERPVLLGDMREEFAEHLASSRAIARAWYWRQAVASFPHLMYLRLQSDTVRQLGLMLLAVPTAFLMITLWDIYVARVSARSFAAASQDLSLLAVRTVYFIVQLTGVALAGAMIAVLTFRKAVSLGHNLLYRIVPALMLILGPSLVRLLFADETYPTIYGMLRIGLTIPVLVLGASVAAWLFVYRSRD